MRSSKEKVQHILQSFVQSFQLPLPPCDQLHHTIDPYIMILKKLQSPNIKIFKDIALMQSQEEQLKQIIHYIQNKVLNKSLKINCIQVIQGNYDQILKLFDSFLQIAMNISNKQKQKNQNKIKKSKSNEKKIVNSKNKINQQTKEKPKTIKNQVQQIISKIKEFERPDNIKKIKNNNPQIIQKTRKQYYSNLKQYQKQRPYSSKPPSEYNLKHFSKTLLHKQKQYNQKVDLDKQKHMVEMREKKLQYMNKVHNIVQKLQKEKILDQKNQLSKLNKQQAIMTNNQLQSMQNIFNNELQKLKQKRKQNRIKKQTQKINQKQLMLGIQKQIKQSKNNQISKLRIGWQSQKTKIKQMLKKDQQFQNKITKIYNKY